MNILFYGACANEWFRYYDNRIASAITLSGQLAIRSAMNIFPKDMIVYGDTDSMALTLEKQVNQFKEKKPKATIDDIISFMGKLFNDKIQPLIDKNYNDLAEYMNCNENKMVMKCEKLASAGLYSGKKRYALNVYNEEGVQFAEPKLKVTGIEIKRSSTPAIIKPYLKESLLILLSDNPDKIRSYVNDVRQEFYTWDPEDIAFPRSVDGIKKYYDPYAADLCKPKTPIHVRGSIVYNKYIKDNKLEINNLPIMDGNKIKFIYLKEPNKVQSKVIAFLRHIPTQEIRNMVDYKTQFDKVYLSVIENITNKIGMNISKVQTKSLEDLI